MVSPLQYRQEGSLAVRSLGLKDLSNSPVKVTLFDTLATPEYLPDAVIELTSLYQKTYVNRKPLTATRDSKFQFVADSDVQRVACNEEDEKKIDEDPDFKGFDANCTPKTLIVDTIYELALYEACKNTGCRLKKFVDNKCPICGKTVSGKTVRLKVEILDEDTQKHFTVFQRDAEKIFDMKISNETSEDDLIMILVTQLPVTTKAKIIRNDLVDIENI